MSYLNSKCNEIDGFAPKVEGFMSDKDIEEYKRIRCSENITERDKKILKDMYNEYGNSCKRERKLSLNKLRGDSIKLYEKYKNIRKYSFIGTGVLLIIIIVMIVLVFTIEDVTAINRIKIVLYVLALLLGATATTLVFSNILIYTANREFETSNFASCDLKSQDWINPKKKFSLTDYYNNNKVPPYWGFTF